MHQIDHPSATTAVPTMYGNTTQGSMVIVGMSTTEDLYINAPLWVSLSGINLRCKVTAVAPTTITVDTELPQTAVNVPISLYPFLFTEGDPTNGRVRTIVTDSWANAVQEELAQAVLLSSQLDKHNHQQLYGMLRDMVSGSISGFEMRYVDAETVSFGAGVCLDKNRNQLISLGAGGLRYKTMGIYGEGEGGRPAAVPAAPNTTWFVFAIKKITGEVDFGFDTSENASNLMLASEANYFRLIDVVRTGVDPSQFLPFDTVAGVRFLQNGLFLNSWEISGSPADYSMGIPSLLPSVVEVFLSVTGAAPWSLEVWLNRGGDNVQVLYGETGHVQCSLRISPRSNGTIRLRAASGAPLVSARVLTFKPQIL